MKNIIVIHHRSCSDGLFGAFSFYKKYPEAIFYAARAGDSSYPDITNKEVFIVDFSYSHEVLLEMKSKAKSIVLLDHHKSAMERLSDLDFCHFDMERSGCGLAWDYLFPKKSRPWFIDYAEDKDLWKWSLPNSREINCNIQSRPLTFEAVHELEKLNPNSWWGRKKWNDFLKEGIAILRAQRNMVTNIVDKAYEVEIQNYKVLCVNTPVLQSEVAGFLAHNRPFAAAYFENETGDKVYSLRSKEHGIDVSKITMIYGGGGHARSAGFRLGPGEKL